MTGQPRPALLYHDLLSSWELPRPDFMTQLFLLAAVRGMVVQRPAGAMLPAEHRMPASVKL